MSATERKILVTGASGLVGGRLAALAAGRWEVAGTYGRHPFDLPGVEAVSLNLEDGREIRSMVRRLRPDAVAHCAAWSDLDRCEREPGRAFRINTDASRILAAACAETGSRFVFASSDMVFDGDKGDYAETDPVNPLSVYGESKVRAEEQIRQCCPNHAVARLALVYGSSITAGRSFSDKLVSAWREGKTTPLFTDQYRTPVHVVNLARALLELAESGFTGTIHLGGPEKVSRHAFGLRLAEAEGFPADRIRPSSLAEVMLSAKRPRDASLDIALAKRALKTRLAGIREGLERREEPEDFAG